MGPCVNPRCEACNPPLPKAAVLELPDVLEAGSAREQAFFAVVPLHQTAADLTGVTGFWSAGDDK